MALQIVRDICTACGDGSWGHDGYIYFLKIGAGRSVHRVPQDAGDEEVVLQPMLDQGVGSILRANLVPGTDVVLFEMTACLPCQCSKQHGQRRNVLEIAFYPYTGHPMSLLPL